MSSEEQPRSGQHAESAIVEPAPSDAAVGELRALRQRSPLELMRERRTAIIGGLVSAKLMDVDFAQSDALEPFFLGPKYCTIRHLFAGDLRGGLHHRVSAEALAAQGLAKCVIGQESEAYSNGTYQAHLVEIGVGDRTVTKVGGSSMFADNRTSQEVVEDILVAYWDRVSRIKSAYDTRRRAYIQQHDVVYTVTQGDQAGSEQSTRIVVISNEGEHRGPGSIRAAYPMLGKRRN